MLILLFSPREKVYLKQNDEKLENLQQEIGDLKKQHGEEIVLLKNEVLELKEKLHAQMATNETNDNLNLVNDAVINPSEFQQEYVINTEITIKEEPIE